MSTISFGVAAPSASAKATRTVERLDMSGLSRRRIAKQEDNSHGQQAARSLRHEHGSKMKYQILKLFVFATVMATVAIIGHSIVNGESTTRSLRCMGGQQSSQSFILVASHLRQGPDGELRLRIIEHNLRLLHETNDVEKPLKSIVIFSLDGSDGEGVYSGMVENWLLGAAEGIVDKVMFVQNDPVLVDASKVREKVFTTISLSWYLMALLLVSSPHAFHFLWNETNLKWTTALYKILPEIRRMNARVVLMNDSFLLVRNVPELLDDRCGDVCGLVWTGAKSDPKNHIQSYFRSMSACDVENYIRLYESSRDSVQSVNEFISQFEINLDWAKGTVSALYDYPGAHPDEDKAQKALILQGYPAIKLKKFFDTDDPWLSEDEHSRTRLPPSFSTVVYKTRNHDLNHLSEDNLKNHFATSGKHEGRIFSTRKLVFKSWIKDKLTDMGAAGESALKILEDYLDALNTSIALTESDKNR